MTALSAFEPFKGAERPVTVAVTHAQETWGDGTTIVKRVLAPGEKIESLAEGIRSEMPPIPWLPVVRNCAFLGEALKTGGAAYDQTLWMYTILAATFMQDGEELAHKMASGHSEYTREETQAMWKRKIWDRQEKKIGWPACETIAGAGCSACAACPHLSEGKSPLHLGLAALNAKTTGNTEEATAGNHDSGDDGAASDGSAGPKADTAGASGQAKPNVALYAPGNEDSCRRMLDRVVADDPKTFTLGDRSGPLVILRVPEKEDLPNETKWEGDLPGATIATNADVMLRAERLEWHQLAGGKSASQSRTNRTHPPRNFVNDYLPQMKGQYSARVLRGIARVPRMDDLGNIHFCTGYDSETGLYHDRLPNLKVPLAPSLDYAKEAATLLLRPFSKYQFEDAVAGNALVLSAVFTVLLRPFLPLVPIYAVRSSMPGTGKGKVARALSHLAFDTPPVSVTFGNNAEEFEKRLTGVLLQSPGIISVDNANGMQIKGDLLESIVTEGYADVRPLGKSDIVRVRCRAFLTVTGNNPVITGDMARRALPIDIVPKSADPERDRYPFDPVDLVRRHRTAFLGAAYAIMRAFRQAGMPSSGLPAVGSFDVWSHSVRDLVYWLTNYDLAEAFHRNKAEDPRRQTDAALLAALFGNFGQSKFSAAEVAKIYQHVRDARRSPQHVAPANVTEIAVHDALEEVLSDKNINAQSIGRWAGRIKGAVTGGFILDTSIDPHTKVNEIAIRKA